jgi:hypothetical protein
MLLRSAAQTRSHSIWYSHQRTKEQADHKYGIGQLHSSPFCENVECPFCALACVQSDGEMVSARVLPGNW